MSRTAVIVVVGTVVAVLLGVVLPSVRAGGFTVNSTALVGILVGSIIVVGAYGSVAKRK